LNLCIAPFFALLEGCGKVAHVALARFAQGVFSSLCLWLTLWFHGGLYAGSASQIGTVVAGVVWLTTVYGRFLGSLLKTNISQAPFAWWKEVWPFQWRIAVSWLSGYFIFQLFTPVLFATRGPVVAGQMGMSLALCSAVLSVCMAWVSTKAAPFGVLAARRDWGALDHLFFRTTKQSFLLLFTANCLLLIGLVLFNQIHHPLARRLISPFPFAFLLIANLANHLVFCESYYLRTHKTEPFMALSVVSGALMCLSTYSLARPFGAFGVSAGYLVCCLVTLAWGTRIFIRKRQEWHA
jgi:hypothetical protein